MKGKSDVQGKGGHSGLKGGKGALTKGQQAQSVRPDKIGQGANIKQNTRNQGYQQDR